MRSYLWLGLALTNLSRRPICLPAHGSHGLQVGLMGAVADAALAEGGEVIGVMPRSDGPLRGETGLGKAPEKVGISISLESKPKKTCHPRGRVQAAGYNRASLSV